MKPSIVAKSVHTLARNRRPFFIWGDPGVGKSQIVAQMADVLYGDGSTPLSSAERPYLRDIRAVLLDPVDLMGIPTVTPKGRTTWAPPSWLPTKGEGILFLDELNRAPLMVQNACLQLALDRRLGEYTLPEGWAVGAAGNYESETGVQRMPDALRSRFTHLKLEADLNDWTRYAASRDFAPQVQAFLRFRPELLHKYDRAVARRENAYPCPRTWEFVSEITKSGISSDLTSSSQEAEEIELGLIAGTVGEGAASEYVQFLRVYRQMPDMDAIIQSPAKSRVPTSPSLCYAVASALAMRATVRNVANVLQYLGRFESPEYAAMAVQSMTSRDSALYSAPAVTRWLADNSDLFVG